MSHPYVIWTMRRTGGTTLASLLATLSEHPGIQHEPFNSDRKFGHIAAEFARNGDEVQLRAALHDCLENSPVIKHCYELMSQAFNTVFMDVTTALGYRHIVLDRRNETDRIVSLELAHLTGAWGGEAAQKIYPDIEAGVITLEPLDTTRALREMRLCNTRRKELAQAMAALNGVTPFVVYFEDVYSDPQEGRALVARVLAFLDIQREAHTDYENLVDSALLKRGQNSSRILQAVPDVEAAINILKAEHTAHESVFTAS